MEFVVNVLIDKVLDPVVLTSSVVVCASLLSGLGARLAEAWEDRQPVRPTRRVG